MPATSETRSSSPDRAAAEPAKRGFDLSVTQIVGGALAAMTAAYLGSRFSLAGTVIGAAVASVVAGLAGAIYTASLRHTRDKVRSVWSGRTGTTPTGVVVTEAPSAADAASAPASSSPASTPLWRTGRFWKRIGIGALATFALAFGAITGLELVSGQALSGGDGTTISRVQQPQPNTTTDEPSESPSASPSDSASDAPSESPSDSASDAPSESASDEAGQASEAPSTRSDQTEAPSSDSSDEASQAPAEQGAQGADSGANPGADSGANPAG